MFAPVTSLPKIGPKLGQAFARLLPTRADGLEPHVASLLFLLPHRVIDRRRVMTLAEAWDGDEATFNLRVEEHQWAPAGKTRLPHRILCGDDFNTVTLTFFQMKRPWLESAYPIGETVTVFGRLESFNGRFSMVHPDRLTGNADDGTLALVEPVYPLVQGLGPRVVKNAAHAALERLPALPEWGEPSVLLARGLPSFSAALARANACFRPRFSRCARRSSPW
ncbi:MAG: hypothetical protein HC779_07575 [Phyllobacteriaceae bacterium]|nr:hypothetical protein [Phyllobacteriaceae bacterium]